MVINYQFWSSLNSATEHEEYNQRQLKIFS